MKWLLVILLPFYIIQANAQKKKPIPETFIVKSNILNLLANKPTISFEKAFNKTYSLEFTLVQGEFNNVLLTDHYEYSGILLRGKKYYEELYYEIINPYYGAYIGLLSRTIQSGGFTDNSGYIGVGSRSFYGRSFRAGGSLGANYITKDRIIIDAQASVGLGAYYNQLKNSSSKGYPDMQIWLSIGYCF